jgi:D-arabinose 1-dehydrogenase-like Zn-dependent alcohol dehydrogenase
MVEGKAKPVVDSKYKFEDLREAYQRLKTGRAKEVLVRSMQLIATPILVMK